MSAARIVTTTEKFDEMGKLVERITREEIMEESVFEREVQSEYGKRKAAEIRIPFLRPDAKELAMEVYEENGRILERPRSAEMR